MLDVLKIRLESDVVQGIEFIPQCQIVHRKTKVPVLQTRNGHGFHLQDSLAFGHKYRQEAWLSSGPIMWIGGYIIPERPRCIAVGILVLVFLDSLIMIMTGEMMGSFSKFPNERSNLFEMRLLI